MIRVRILETTTVVTLYNAVVKLSLGENLAGVTFRVSREIQRPPASITLLWRLYFCTPGVRRGIFEGAVKENSSTSESDENEGDETLTVRNERGRDQGLSEKARFGARVSGVTLPESGCKRSIIVRKNPYVLFRASKIPDFHIEKNRSTRGE